MTWSGFHRLGLQQRLERVQAHAGLADDEVAALRAPSALADDDVAGFIENAVGTFAVPLGFAVGFRIDGEDVVVPMAVEESSVVAAACNGAKLAAAGGGFTTAVMDPVTIGQIEVRHVADLDAAMETLGDLRPAWIDQANDAIPSMVARGGGVRDITARIVEHRVVVHLHVDTRDAMGANVVNTLCELLAEPVAEALGGQVGLRILSNLATDRIAEATARIPVEFLGGLEVAKAIVAANDFAIADPFRAATHNKGILNGIDPVVLATGNDWRAVEAGAHAFAAYDGRYRALTDYAIDGDALVATLTLPLSVGTVGGVTRLHPTAAACLAVLGKPNSKRLAGICAAVGLAQNLAALRALSQEGIQDGHMRLHQSNADMRVKGP